MEALWRDAGWPHLPTRFGLARGTVLVGNIGARSRLAYTVLGDRVNLASRIEGLNKVYGTCLLAEDGVHAACAAKFAWRRLDRIVVLGRSEPSWIYEILGTAEDASERVRRAARRYEAAWDAYAARDFGKAIADLEALRADGCGSFAADRLLEICRRLRERPPGEDWDAVTRMDRK
jgi:hypothetical protein